MKRILGILSAALLLPAALLGAAEPTDYWYFGESRANQPGPEILSSVYAENPARIADAIRNSVSYSLIGMFGPLGPSLGMSYSLSVPGFTAFGITENADGITLDLLGAQCGLSTRSFLPDLPVQAAAGFSLLRAGRAESGVTDGSFRVDVGASASIASLRVEALVKNALVSSASGIALFGSAADYGLSVGGKIILDIDCVLGASFCPALAASAVEGVEMAGTLKFIRYFFDNSLRAGVELQAYADLDKPANVLPVVEYGLAVSYILPDFFPRREGSAARGDLLATGLSFLRNLSLDASARFLVNNFPDRQGLRAAVSFGLTKLY